MRIVIADDAALFRDALASALRAAGHEIVAEARDATGLVERVSRTRPDLVLLDVRMPPTKTTEGLEAAVRIREAAPNVGILILSQDVQTHHVVRLLRDSPEGVGYLLKDRVRHLGDLLDAVHRVGAGGFVVDPEIVSILFGRRRPPGPLDELTPRERDVLREMAEGRSNVAIAERLGLTERTVEANIRVILSKLGLEPDAGQHRRVLAVLTYLKES
jgi:DNA-binding NarL/FixJ family response regulator